MMIRASYSNRFAYLSWFLYALVLAYPCLKFPIWKDQGRKASFIFLAHLGFTLFMNLIYYHHQS
jgi:predicted GNAT superfamily acetyltransferase